MLPRVWNPSHIFPQFPPISRSLTLSNLILSIASLTRIKQLSGRNTSSIYSETCQTSLIGQTCHDNVWAILWLLDTNLATQQVTWMNSLLKSYGVLHSLHPQFTLFPHTSPSRVFSIRPLTPRASSAFLSFRSWAEMIGVLMDRDALMISFMRGTPSVMSDYIKKTN